MENLKVGFVDFWPEFNYENAFLPILQKYFNVEITTHSPDIIISSIFNRDLQAPKFHNAKKFLFLGENHRPNQFPHMYSISFDPHSEKNFRLPLWQFYLILKPELKEILFNRNNNANFFERFASFTVSNPHNFFRNSFYDQLNSYKRVHSYGRFKVNDFSLQHASQGKYWRDAKYEFFLQRRHKFAITYEHSSYPGYCTEKLMDGFLGGSIPIYWGDPRIHKEWNEKAFINSMKLGSDTFETIKKLDNDPKLFEEMYNAPVFTDEQRESHIENMENFENWLIEKIKN